MDQASPCKGHILLMMPWADTGPAHTGPRELTGLALACINEGGDGGGVSITLNTNFFESITLNT